MNKTLNTSIESFLNGKEINSPFERKTKLIIVRCQLNDDSIIIDILNNIYNHVNYLKYHELLLLFISDKNELNIENLFTTISADLGYDVLVQDGIYLNNNMSKEDILLYISIYENIKQTIPYYDIADFVLNTKEEDYFSLLKVIDHSNFTYIYKDINTMDIIQTLIKYNLNVLQTSKLLYIHRNSILNKIEIIYKETGFNIQNFSNASIVNHIIKIHKNEINNLY